MCDVCVNGLPEKQNLKEEADTFMRVISAHYVGFTDFSIFLHYFIYLFICVISSSIFA